MRKQVIVSVDKPLTAKERRDFSKNHPGYRLSFMLRYPYLPSRILSIAAIVISIIVLLK